MEIYKALIRTHHITSRKKVATLRHASRLHDVFVLLCYGKSPGIMYVEGTEPSVKAWIRVAHDLRYKDYHLIAKPSVLESTRLLEVPLGRTDEVTSVSDFGKEMELRRIGSWWRKAMGYKHDENNP